MLVQVNVYALVAGCWEMGEQLRARKGPVLTARAALCLTTTVAALARGKPPAELANKSTKKEPLMGNGGSGNGIDQSRKAEHPVLKVINRGGEGRLREWLGEKGYERAITVLSGIAISNGKQHISNPSTDRLQLNTPTGYTLCGDYMGGSASMDVWIVNCLPDGTRTGMMGFGEICMTTTGDVYFRYYQPNYSVQSATGEYVSIPLPVIR